MVRVRPSCRPARPATSILPASGSGSACVRLPLSRFFDFVAPGRDARPLMAGTAQGKPWRLARPILG